MNACFIPMRQIREPTVNAGFPGPVAETNATIFNLLNSGQIGHSKKFSSFVNAAGYLFIGWGYHLLGGWGTEYS